MIKKRHFIALFLIALIGGCNGAQLNPTTPITAPEAPDVILIATQSGGCIRTGPNCSLHTLYDDGSVTAARASIGEIETRGQIDTGQVTSLNDLIATTDFDSLRNRLPAGTCAGCVDGVDYEYKIQTDSVQITFSSIDHKFDPAEPFFALANGIYESMQNAAPLDIRRRN